MEKGTCYSYIIMIEADKLSFIAQIFRKGNHSSLLKEEKF
ncbi:hypothetical protein BACINT_00228 [Bacteroides intestinalis DSM 17393]|uniref:Uncharacterized protein n=1 Tax=Bacteroides intestinalis DSM 17393 TaxID=471870 RepID=B3C5P4_9BACE|nr:hypothetical protein BACINT_00228 [Bacteroides intestinalis DSM 17393]